MSSQLLPQHVSLRKSVNSRAKYASEMPVSVLPRIAEIVVDMAESAVCVNAQSGNLTVQLEFSIGDNGKPTVFVAADGVILLECQRCLQPMKQSVSIEALLTVVRHDEEAKNRLSEIEPLIVADDSLDIHALLEDEILLSLPIVPMHKMVNSGSESLDVCRPAMKVHCSGDNVDSDSSPSAVAKTVTKKENPFAALAGLVSKK